MSVLILEGSQVQPPPNDSVPVKERLKLHKIRPKWQNQWKSSKSTPEFFIATSPVTVRTVASNTSEDQLSSIKFDPAQITQNGLSGMSI